MKESQEIVKKSVLMLGEKLNILESTEELLINEGIHSTIKELIYRSFIDNYNDYFEENDNIYESIQIIRKYCRELSKNGHVNFNDK